MSTNVLPDPTIAFGPRVNALWAIARYVFAFVGLALLAYGSVLIAKDGLSSLFVQNSVDNSSMALANEAIRLNSLNSDAYQARASLYQKSGQTKEAIKDLERAVELRPNDHYLWLELGYLRYQSRDMDGAVTDFRESARLAPFYAQPRWYLGNVLLQTGKTDEGFAEIRRAVASDPLYLAEAIERADEIYGGDPRALVQALQPQTSMARLTLAQYLIKHDRVSAAIELFREAGEGMSPADGATLISELLTARKFAEAHEVWLTYHPSANDKRNSIPLVEDGSFENEIADEGLGFGWQVSHNLQRVSVVRDQGQPGSGAYCLRLDFEGISSPETPIVSQIVMTEPATRYELGFASRTRELITGGPPVVEIIDSNSGKTLAQSKALTENQTQWDHQSMEFSTPGDTLAVMIIVKRKTCSSSPCPAFGHAWFDSFVCKKL